MTFRRANPNFHYRALRLVSNEGRWELGLSHYASGIRLRMGPAGRPPSVLDFCIGTDPSLVPAVLLAVLRLLGPIAESASAGEIDAAFPWADTRPDLARHLPALTAAASRTAALAT